MKDQYINKRFPHLFRTGKTRRIRGIQTPVHLRNGHYRGFKGSNENSNGHYDESKPFVTAERLGELLGVRKVEPVSHYPCRGPESVLPHEFENGLLRLAYTLGLPNSQRALREFCDNFANADMKEGF